MHNDDDDDDDDSLYYVDNTHHPAQNSISQYHIVKFNITGGAKVYDVTKYLDDHPGGAEVMLDVAGQDADEFFEDIGHSKEARKELAKYEIGKFKLDEATKAKLAAEAEAKAKKSAAGSGLPLPASLIALVAILIYLYLKSQGK